MFLEIGLDRDHAHFLIQSVRTYSPTKIVTTVKSLIAREVFAKVPAVQDKLWGGEFWGKGCFINTVGQHGGEQVIAAYVANQGSGGSYEQLHKGQMVLGLPRMPRDFSLIKHMSSICNIQPLEPRQAVVIADKACELQELPVGASLNAFSSSIEGGLGCDGFEAQDESSFYGKSGGYVFRELTGFGYVCKGGRAMDC